MIDSHHIVTIIIPVHVLYWYVHVHVISSMCLCMMYMYVCGHIPGTDGRLFHFHILIQLIAICNVLVHTAFVSFTQSVT